MKFNNPFLVAFLIALPFFALHLFLAWGEGVERMTNEQQGELVGSVLAAHVFAAAITGALGRFALKSAAWPKLLITYVVVFMVLWAVTAFGE